MVYVNESQKLGQVRICSDQKREEVVEASKKMEGQKNSKGTGEWKDQ